MRIVSLCPSITESLVALGLGGSLVGVTRYCVHPREALEGIRASAGRRTPTSRRSRALAPDLVLCNAEENRAADVAELSTRHRVDVSHPTRVADVPPMLAQARRPDRAREQGGGLGASRRGEARRGPVAPRPSSGSPT